MPRPADDEGSRAAAVEDRLLELVSEALLGPSSPYTHRAFDLWPDGGQPILGSIGLRGERPETEVIFCYRTTSDPGRRRAMVHRVPDGDDTLNADAAELGSYAHNAITQGELEARDLGDVGDLAAVRWSRESSAAHAIEGHEFDPSRRNVFLSFDLQHDQSDGDDLVEQSKRADSPFVVVGSSATVIGQNSWENTRRMIGHASNVAVLCSVREPVAENVERELHQANGLNKPHFLLGIGESDSGRKPQMAYLADRIYRWTWENLLTLLVLNGDAPEPPGLRERNRRSSQRPQS